MMKERKINTFIVLEVKISMKAFDIYFPANVVKHYDSSAMKWNESHSTAFYLSNGVGTSQMFQLSHVGTSIKNNWNHFSSQFTTNGQSDFQKRISAALFKSQVPLMLHVDIRASWTLHFKGFHWKQFQWIYFVTYNSNWKQLKCFRSPGI